jgi:hypothetical protein
MKALLWTEVMKVNPSKNNASRGSASVELGMLLLKNDLPLVSVCVSVGVRVGLCVCTCVCL